MIDLIDRPDALLDRVRRGGHGATREGVSAAMEVLNPRQLLVITRRYAATPWTLEEISSDIGASSEAVQLILDRSIALIRNALGPR